MRINKSKELKNPIVKFLSLVEHPNIMKPLLVAKSKGGEKEIKYLFKNKILSGDDEIIEALGFGEISVGSGEHLCIGCAYPANEEDYDGEFMREDAVALVKKTLEANGNMVDIEHDEEARAEISIAKSIILDEDMEFYDTEGKYQKINKGSMISGVVVKEDIFKKVQDKEITGFSIGGQAEIVSEEVEIGLVEKAVQKALEFVGIKKGAVLDAYNQDVKLQQARTNISSAYWVFRGYVFPEDGTIRTPEEIQTALDDFIKIMEENLLVASGTVVLKTKKGGQGEMTDQEKKDLAKSIKEEVKAEVQEDMNELKTENAELKKKVDAFEAGENKKIEKAKAEEMKEVKKYAEKKGVEIADEDTLEVAITKCVKNFNPEFNGSEDEAKGAWTVMKSMYSENSEEPGTTGTKEVKKSMSPETRKMLGLEEEEE